MTSTSQHTKHTLTSFSKSHLAHQSEFINSLLSQQFADFNHHHIEYRRFFSNHSTHFVVAFSGLRDRFGLWQDYDAKSDQSPSARRLRSYIRWYEEKLEDQGDVDEDALKKIRENEEYMWSHFHNISSTKVEVKREYAAVLKYFLEKEHDTDLLDWRMKEKSLDLLNEYIPKMSQSICGAAFHGLIETGWRIEAGFSLAPGLAYMVVRGLDMGRPTPLSELTKEENGNPLALLKKVAMDRKFDDIFEDERGFQTRMRVVASHADLLNDYDIYLDPSSDYDALQEFCEQLNEQLYVLFTSSEAKADFFILHTITALHAMRNVLGHLRNRDDQINLVRNYWRALVSAFIVLGRPLPQRGAEPNFIPESWDENVQRANRLEHIDAHWYKLFYVSALTEERSPRLASLMREAVDLYYREVKSDDYSE